MQEKVALSIVISQSAKDKNKMKQLFLYINLVQNNINDRTASRITQCGKPGKILVILNIQLWREERNLFSTAISESSPLCCTIQPAITNLTVKTLSLTYEFQSPSHGFLYCSKKQSRAHHSKYMTLRKLESFSKNKINPTF